MYVITNITSLYLNKLKGQVVVDFICKQLLKIKWFVVSMPEINLEEKKQMIVAGKQMFNNRGLVPT